MIGSKFIESDLTGADFRNADLTQVIFHKCDLYCSKFYRTRRGGLKLQLDKESTETNEKQKTGEKESTETNGKQKTGKDKLPNSCKIGCVDWDPDGNGEIQIDEENFLEIVYGKKSPIKVLDDSKALNIYTTNINQANAKSAETINDASMTLGEVSDSDMDGGVVFDIDDEGFPKEYKTTPTEHEDKTEHEDTEYNEINEVELDNTDSYSQ